MVHLQRPGLPCGLKGEDLRLCFSLMGTSLIKLILLVFGLCQ